jgi:anti-sigma factor RsiW
MTTFTGQLTDAQAQRLVDGVLLADEALEVEAHVRGCLECEALVAEYRALGDALSDLELPPLPSDFTEGVLALVETRERAVARERRIALGIAAGVLAALVVVAALLGAGTWAPAAAELVDSLGSAGRALRLGAQVLPPLFSALRLPIALACAALAFPLVVALSRLMTPSPRTEIA